MGFPRSINHVNAVKEADHSSRHSVSALLPHTMAKANAQKASQSGQTQAKSPKKLSYPTVIHPDLYQRSNFTLQASAFLQQLNLESPSSDVKGKRKAHQYDVDVKRNGSDSEKLARNMMAANGKMVVHNQLKLFVPSFRIKVKSS
jgi:hypothetical protein